MKLLTGSNGMIGKNIKELLPSMLCPTHSELDLTDRGQVKEYLDYHKPEQIIHCASNDDEVCLYDNLRMFINLAESYIPMIIFATGRDIEDRPGKVGEYILSKYIAQELALSKYGHITVLKIWGCFGKYEKETRFFTDNMLRIKRGEPILVKENKLFSYVYVKDLARIINGLEIKNIIHNIVGYTQSLLYYAKILKRVTGLPYDIVVENKIGTNYSGENTFDFNYTPLSIALKEMWECYR
uniref:Putative NADH dehydrogenase n=1 Tax=viral metagenome TaxID=1070528 RepID=A0A6M3IUK6_9ZZZZ